MFCKSSNEKRQFVKSVLCENTKIRPMFLGVFCVLVLFLSQLANAAALFRVDPYLQNSSGTSITVMCISSESVTGTVDLYSSGSTTIKKTVIMQIAAIPNTSFYRCDAKLTGLTPGTQYDYIVTLKDSLQQTNVSAIASLRTLDPTGNNCRFAVVGDLHNRTDTHLSLSQNNINSFEPDFVFYNGDCWSDPTTTNNAQVVFDVTQAFVSQANHESVPLNFIMGNHEWRGDFSSSMAYLFDTNLLDYTADPNQQRYENAFTHGNVRFVYMDCGEDGEKNLTLFSPMREIQLNWLKTEIASPEFQNARWRVLLIHIPLTGTGWVDGSAEYWRQTIIDAKPEFDVMFAGHVHQPKITPANSEYPFPVLWTGGPDSTTPWSERAASIQVDANETKLNAEIRSTTGQLIDSLTRYP